MADTLYDENRGGRYGNTHLALGASFRDCYGGDTSKLTSDDDWSQLGYNNSSVHTDIVSTSNRTVDVETYDGKKVCIYKDGRFVI
jgi:aminopeptidase